MKNTKKIIISLLLILLLIISMFFTWFYSQVNGALPKLEGKTTIFGLANSVVIARDQQGIPTIKAKNRVDLAVATGFIHAQERFFQMDLLRKNAAGELSSLFGKVALDYDKSIRQHRFRQRARTIVQQLPLEQLDILKAYTNGVNAGLRQLKSSPFEYLLLQQDPVEWQEEDTVLTVLSMYLDLQYKQGQREQTLGLLQSTLSPEAYAFLNPKGSIWDAAIDNSQYQPSPMPEHLWLPTSAKLSKNNIIKHGKTDYQSGEFPGSNNWAIAGEISNTGSAIVANDMHLGIRVPNTWFRASFEYSSNENSSKQNRAIKVTGLTLPGTPNIIAGSNGHIAWGFTNSYGDWNDVIILETNSDQSQYLTPQGYLDFTEHNQIIAIKDEPAIEITVKETIWGPVIGNDHNQNLLAYRWVAHDVEAVNFKHLDIEQATSVENAFLIAAQSGMPAQNIMIGDKTGNIGWTIAGPIPRKSAEFGDIPTSWANGQHTWQGYLTPDEYPKVKNPQKKRLWTANSRVVGGEMYDKLGNGGYALGARSQQIRDNLFAKDEFDEQALLAIALDDKAVFLKRWQQFILEKVMTTESLKLNYQWPLAKQLLQEKSLHAAVDSVAYRMTQNFRINVRNSVFHTLNENLENISERYDFHTIRHQIETPLWTLINQQPYGFLSQSQGSWSEVLQRALNKTLDDMSEEQPLTAATWGQQNTTFIRHPLSSAVPFIGQWLDMPSTQLSGDSYMPRVQGKAFGASERMVVSPGHEESGILHMPTSQAGHPWSPYYGLGHKDWEQGKATPFLPGKTKYTLTLLSY